MIEEVNSLIIRNIEQLKNPIKKEILFNKIRGFEKYKVLVREKYSSLLNDYQVKTELKAFHDRYINLDHFETYIEEKTIYNIIRFYHNYMFYAKNYFDVCNDIELIEAIEKYFFDIIYECLDEKLDQNWNFTFDPTLRFERTVKYEIDAYKEIFKKLNPLAAQKRIISILEKTRNYNTSGFHEKDIFKNPLLEEFLVGYYDTLDKQKHLNLEERKREKEKEIISFRLKTDSINIPKLNILMKKLVDKLIISKLDIKDFKKVFLGQRISNPINFIGDSPLVNISYFVALMELKYKVLISENKVNMQICYCFTVNNKTINIGYLEQVKNKTQEYFTNDSSVTPPDMLKLIDKIINDVKFTSN